jgi:hypothetical protein
VNLFLLGRWFLLTSLLWDCCKVSNLSSFLVLPWVGCLRSQQPLKRGNERMANFGIANFLRRRPNRTDRAEEKFGLRAAAERKTPPAA